MDKIKAEDAGAPKASQGGRRQRRIQNLFLQPTVQIKLGIFSIYLALVFSIAVGGLLYFSLAEVIDAVLLLTDVEAEIRAFLFDLWTRIRWWLFGIVAIFMIANVVVSIVYTHRLVGPTISFRKHIRELAQGNFTAMTVLRKGDAFFEVAEDLNELSRYLTERFDNQKNEEQMGA